MPEPVHATLFGALQDYVRARIAEFDRVDAERRAALALLSDRLRTDREHGATTDLIFICTHNSRRSHFGQVWAQVAAAWFGLHHVHTYSGGTEATAFDLRALSALERAGLQVERGTGASNPVHTLRMGDEGAELPVLRCFSKRYDDASNPRENFVAVMTCAQADADCPLVLGARARIALPYTDPKLSDGTPQERATYDARCAQIARELLFAFDAAALNRDRRAGSPRAAGHDPAR